MNDNLENANKNDNNLRVMITVIAVLVLLIVGLCAYIFVFKDKSPSNNNNSEPQTENSTAVENSKPDEPDSGLSEPEQTSDTASEPSSLPSQSQEPASIEPSEPDDTSSQSSQSEEPLVDHGMCDPSKGYNGYAYVYEGIALEQFNYSKTSSIPDYFTEAINTLHSFSGKSKFYNILVPTRCEFVDIPGEIRRSDDFFIGNQKQYMSMIFDKTEEGIIDVDVYNAFEERYKNNEYIFFNADTNYTHLGAYTAYTEFCKAAGISPVSKEMYTMKQMEGNFYGILYDVISYNNDTEQKRHLTTLLDNNADVFYYYDIDEIYSSVIKNNDRAGQEGVIYSNVNYDYYCFMQGEYAKTEITTQAKTGKKALVIGDSSSTAFTTFLVPHYEKITIINENLYNKSIIDLIMTGGYNDIILINYNTTASRTIYQNLNILAGIQK